MQRCTKKSVFLDKVFLFLPKTTAAKISVHIEVRTLRVHGPTPSPTHLPWRRRRRRPPTSTPHSSSSPPHHGPTPLSASASSSPPRHPCASAAVSHSSPLPPSPPAEAVGVAQGKPPRNPKRTGSCRSGCLWASPSGWAQAASWSPAAGCSLPPWPPSSSSVPASTSGSFAALQVAAVPRRRGTCPASAPPSALSCPSLRCKEASRLYLHWLFLMPWVVAKCLL